MQGWHQWIAGWGYDIDAPGPDLRPEAVLPRIREMIGDPGVEVEIENVTTWQINQAWAARYSKDRVFCGSDAVYRHPPSSGLGSNTSSAPVGAQVVACANQSRIAYGPVNAAFRTEGQADPSPRAWPSSATPALTGGKAREALIEEIEYKNTEFNAQGTELNQRYESSAVIPDPDAGEEVWKRDRGLVNLVSSLALDKHGAGPYCGIGLKVVS